MTKRLLALASALLASPAWSDTMINHVNGMQVGADGRLQHFNTLVIDGQGKVKAVLNRTGAYKAGITDSMDGGGRTLLPGFVDAHGHVMDLGFAALHLDLTGTTSLADLQQRLRDYA